MFSAYDKDLGPLYAAIGKLTVRWAWLEYVLESCITMFSNRCGASSIGLAFPPYSLEQKLIFFDRSLSEINALSEFCSRGLVLSSDIKNLAEQRNSLIHDKLYTFGPDFRSFRFIQHKINTTPSERGKTLRKIQEAIKKIEKSTSALMVFSLDVLEKFPD